MKIFFRSVIETFQKINGFQITIYKYKGDTIWLL